MSDHVGQSTTFNTIILKPPTKQVVKIRKINKYTISHFLTELSYETWDVIFSSDDVNEMLNSFIDTYLKIFYSSFPFKNFKSLTEEMIGSPYE